MRKILFIIILLSAPLLCLAQNDWFVETSEKEYTVSKEGKLDNFSLIIKNKSRQDCILLYKIPTGTSWFDITYEGAKYRIKNFTYFYDTLDVQPEYMRNRLVSHSQDFKMPLEGYLVRAEEKIIWSFSPIEFGYSSGQSDLSKTEKAETIEINVTYTFPYMTQEEFPSNMLMVTTNSFDIICTKGWFYHILKDKVE